MAPRTSNIKATDPFTSKVRRSQWNFLPSKKDFGNFKTHLKQLFGISGPIEFSYQDNEEDCIICSSEVEYKAFVKVLESLQPLIHIGIVRQTKKSPSQRSNTPISENVTFTYNELFFTFLYFMECVTNNDRVHREENKPLYFFNFKTISKELGEAVNQFIEEGKIASNDVHHSKIATVLVKVLDICCEYANMILASRAEKKENEGHVQSRKSTVQKITKLVRPLFSNAANQDLIIKHFQKAAQVCLCDQNITEALHSYGKRYVQRQESSVITSREENKRTMSARPIFDVHEGIGCNACFAYPLVGVRYKCTSRPHFDMCESCFKSPYVSKQGFHYREIRFAWEELLDDKNVPRRVLKVGNEGPAVLLLHKNLWDMGLGDPSIFCGKTAWTYTAQTEDAVKKMQKIIGMGCKDQNGSYDKVTEEKLSAYVEGLSNWRAVTISAIYKMLLCIRQIRGYLFTMLMFMLILMLTFITDV